MIFLDRKRKQNSTFLIQIIYIYILIENNHSTFYGRYEMLPIILTPKGLFLGDSLYMDASILTCCYASIYNT